jgi:hypothetical protein
MQTQVGEDAAESNPGEPVVRRSLLRAVQLNHKPLLKANPQLSPNPKRKYLTISIGA